MPRPWPATSLRPPASTGKLDSPRNPEAVREDVLALRAWKPTGTDFEAMDLAWTVRDQYGLSWWNALVVAAAVRSGSRWLLTEDLQAGQEILGLTVVSPFQSAPEDLLGR
jgi:predicted nucleic acid-binding protein